MIKISGPIIAGRSVGGISLGSSIEEFEDVLKSVKKWDASSQNKLQDVILESSSGVLCQFEPLGQKVLYLCSGALELHFNGGGVLFNISIWKDCPGVLWEGIGVGSLLRLVEDKMNLFYDEGDEVHYSDQDCGKGISFYAEELSLDENPDQKIRGISVHDWNLR